MNAITNAPQDLVIATCDTIDIRFAGVRFEIAPSIVGIGAGNPSIRLDLNGVSGQETIARDHQFQRELGEWADRRKADATDNNAPLSKMPGVVVFERITVQVTDDLGTGYRRAGGQVAGGGTEWDATWFYQPAPPPGARTLRFEFSVDGEPSGKHCEISL